MNPGQKTFRPKPPDKGSFPLDHEGECKQFMVSYMQCLKRSNNDNSLCRDESKAYLQCRMESYFCNQVPFGGLNQGDHGQNRGSSLDGRACERMLCPSRSSLYPHTTHLINLMAKEDFGKLGYKDDKNSVQEQSH